MVGTAAIPSETIHRLQSDPVHLCQLTGDPSLYNNPMGCGAFSTAMTMSVFRPSGFAGNHGYAIANNVYKRMIKVPFSHGGTFELQNALTLRSRGLVASMFLFGTFEQVAAAIDLNAPVILLVNPIFRNFRLIGRHDVVLLGYSRDATGAPLNLFTDDPEIKTDNQQAPEGLNYPGNSKIAASELKKKWTGTFTPVFKDAATFQEWKRRAHRHWLIG
jgi:hypothetical protein